MTAPTVPVPNHHADHPGFSGPLGLLLAVGMAWGRAADPAVAMALAGVGPEDDVVDVGCGSGAAARRAAPVARSVVGIDPAPVMLRVARWTTRRGAGIRYREGTAEQLPLDDGTATVLWSLASVHHWHDVDRGLDEARRVLRPGGRLVAVERLVEADATGMRSHGWTPAQAEAFAAALTRHGFEDAEVGRHTTGRRRVLSVRAVRAAG